MKPSQSERKERVNKFREICRKNGLQELASDVFEFKGPFTHTLTISTLIHGNEVGGLEVMLKLLEEIESKSLVVKSNLRLILGNVEAYFEDKRFIETDLNRAFGLAEHSKKEELRAREFERFLQETDVLIDIHQTIGPTSTPFFIFEFEKKSYDLARFLHPTLPIVVINKKRSFQGKTSTAFAISSGAMAITIETGQKAIEETQISLGLAVARKAIGTDFSPGLPASPLSHTYTSAQIINNPDGSLQLENSFSNFDSVKKGELLARNETEKIYAEVDGKILFPKYGEYAKASKELALILKPIKDEQDFLQG